MRIGSTTISIVRATVSASAPAALVRTGPLSSAPLEYEGKRRGVRATVVPLMRTLLLCASAIKFPARLSREFDRKTAEFWLGMGPRLMRSRIFGRNSLYITLQAGNLQWRAVRSRLLQPPF